jgi:hypothetical protein
MAERAGRPREAWAASEPGLQAFCEAKRPEANPCILFRCENFPSLEPVPYGHPNSLALRGTIGVPVGNAGD